MATKQRVERRIAIKVPFRMEGFTDAGEYISTDIITENISKNGICFRLKTKSDLPPGATVRGKFRNDHFIMNWNLLVIWRQGETIGGKLTSPPDLWFVK